MSQADRKEDPAHCAAKILFLQRGDIPRRVLGHNVLIRRFRCTGRYSSQNA